MAGSSHTLTSHTFPRRSGSPIGEVVTAFVGDDGTGAVPTYTFQLPVDAELVSLVTNPGSTAPTANYDITLLDTDSIDVLQGLGANRHTSNSEEASLYYATQLGRPLVMGGRNLVLTIANQAVNSATGTIALRYRRAS